MKTIVNDLVSCDRRIVYRETTQSPWIIQCRPPLAYLKSLSPKELLANIGLVKPQVVAVETCQTCKGISQVPIIPGILKDGTIVYKKDRTDWEPPPLPPGYKRKSNNPKDIDAWVLIPEENLCAHAKLEKKEVLTCGCQRYQLFCTKDNKLILLEQTCQECPYRSEKS